MSAIDAAIDALASKARSASFVSRFFVAIVGDPTLDAIVTIDAIRVFDAIGAAVAFGGIESTINPSCIRQKSKKFIRQL